MTRHIIIAGPGDPCPRCGKPTEIREHPAEWECRREVYYRRWFICRNSNCRTTTIVPDRFRVEPAAERRVGQIAEQLNLEWNSSGVPW